LTAFPQMDAQKAIKACLSGSVSWQSGRRSLLSYGSRFFRWWQKACFVAFFHLLLFTA